MVSATALGDLSELKGPVGFDATLTFFRAVLLLGAICPAILYGSFLHDVLIAPVSSTQGTPAASASLFQINLMHVSIWLAGAMFLLSTTVEALVAKIKGDNEP
jgi:hypothetical protein